MLPMPRLSSPRTTRPCVFPYTTLFRSGEDGGADDDDSAHGRGAALGRMRGRTVVTDELAVSLLDEHPDEQRGAHQREDERQTGCEQYGYHWAPDTPAISSPR